MDIKSPRKPWWRRWFGNRSERAAERFLRRLGYRILKRNYRCSLGELDLVALERDCLVFVEVRSTEGDDRERPAASVGPVKQQRLTQLALSFMQRYRLLGRAARFDVLAVSWPSASDEPHVDHFPNAFEAVGKFQMFS